MITMTFLPGIDRTNGCVCGVGADILGMCPQVFVRGVRGYKVWDGVDGKRRLWHTTVTTYQIARRLANPDAARQAATEEIAASIQGSTQTKARKTLQVLTASIYGHDMIADSKVARAAAEGALQQDQHDSDNDRGKAVV